MNDATIPIGGNADELDIAQTCPHCNKAVAYWSTQRITDAQREIARGHYVTLDQLKADIKSNKELRSALAASEHALAEAKQRYDELHDQRHAEARKCDALAAQLSESRAESERLKVRVESVTLMLDSAIKVGDGLRAQRDAATARVGELERALRDRINATPSHTSHWDREGTSGRNCPACIIERDANEAARAALTHPTEPR